MKPMKVKMKFELISLNMHSLADKVLLYERLRYKSTSSTYLGT